MFHIVKAEALKHQHTFGAWLPVVGPAFTLVLVLPWAGMGSALLAGVWNWWYMLLLPGMLAVFCYLGMKKDKTINYYHLLLVPEEVSRCLLGKLVYAFFGLLSANFLIFAGTRVCGMMFEGSASAAGEFLGFLVLSATYAWEIPLYFLLGARFHMFAVMFMSMAMQAGSLLAGTAYWWVHPAAIPVRLMCPLLGIQPNGLPVLEGSVLESPDVLWPGIGLSLGWLVLLTGCLLAWFKRRAVNG